MMHRWHSERNRGDELTHMLLADSGKYWIGANGIVRIELDIEEFWNEMP